jgi:hypothetical protein
MGQTVALPASCSAKLVVVIDCEEEFDWESPLQGTHFATQSLKQLRWLHDFLRQRRITPTYVIDYPAVQSSRNWEFLEGEIATGGGVVGAHLHPWVNPPFGEERNYANSHPGNLPLEFETAKLESLTQAISERFGVRPKIYKAGRSGIGSESARVLRSLGYEIDLSVVPHWDFTTNGGPDFSRSLAEPYWFGDDLDLLEIPMTAGFVGIAYKLGPTLYPHLESKIGRLLYAPGAFSRAQLLNRIKLSPEGVPLHEAVQLTRSLYNRGQRIFSLSFHSTSLEPGNTPYVSNRSDLAALYYWLDQYVDFFFNDLKGEAATPFDVLALARSGAAGAGAAAN